MATLAQRVEQQDFTTQLEARARGEAAVAELEPLLTHVEPEVRQLAAHCIDEAGGARAVELLLPRLHDDDEQVAMAVLVGLEHHAGPQHVDALLVELDGGVSEELGPRLILLVGRFEAPLLPYLKSGELHQRYRAQTDASCRSAWRTVLAKLGDEDAQREFVQELRASKGEELEVLLQRCEYIGRGWLLPAFDELLDDLTPLVRVGVDGRPELVDALRARERAVLVSDGIARLDPTLPSFQPSFPVSKAVQYDDAQAAEVRAWLRTLPRPPHIYGVSGP